ncbi:succinylglutamate desuccinylase/aspartoacylase family protein [Qaidamihabitans albus]|uniref:succinylglutamate desuccinylase/aspartoacylase family protein n=1 Tax=Qaidamihabitans albus TaxID=2795733 RepID=UPI001F48EAA7|nr:M14 family metallopeptidase [Qaidamihabitans albus]
MSGAGEPSTTGHALPGDATLVEIAGARGPTLALLGGVHGDEDEGVLAVRRVLHELEGRPLTGALRAVAPANPHAWAAYSRTSPLDGANLARSFPGDPRGAPTDVLAAGIAEEVIGGADLLIDLHSAGVRYEMPFFCGYVANTVAEVASRRAAEAFSAPLIWRHPASSPGRSLSVAADRGIPAVYVECSGGGAIRARELDGYVTGVLAVMAEFGMLATDAVPDRRPERRVVHGRGDLDQGAQSKHHGFFVATTAAGAELGAGSEVGRIYGYDGALLDVVRTDQPGVVMFLRRQARTQEGDVLFVRADLDEAGKDTSWAPVGG